MDGCGGLTTAEALQKLYDDIREAVEFECRGAEDYRSGDFCVGVILKSLKSKNPTFTHQRLLLFLLLLKSGCLVMSHVFLPPQNSSTLLLEAFLIFSAGVGNFTLFCWDDWLRKVEMPSRARWLLGVLREWKDKCCWYPDHYPHIHTPQSPSISLQATFRDGNIVNLPWALLVKGDLIVLRPGQTAPGRCHSIKDDTFTLEADDIFSPPIDDQSESLRNPRLRRPLQCGYCQLDETPYVNSVRIVMKEALNRPASVFQKEKHLIFTVCMEKIAAPIFLVLILVVNLVRYFYTSGWHSSGHWADMFLLQPCSILIPLVPLLLPLAWLTMNAFGLAWILALFYTARQYKMSNDPFEDADVTDVPLTHSTFSMKCQETRAYFVDTLLGRGKSPFRTENLLQTLASVTALCCIDKKGILSWPNPTAEKVFFLRNSKFSSGAVEMCSVPSLDPSRSRSGSSKDRVGDTKMETARHKRTSKRELTVGDTTAEVLDLSHDCTTPFRLQFDDPSWQQYLDSLKPLGLAILLNTCNPMSYERYAQFCSHLSSLGQFHEDLVPVVNRRRCEKGRPDINLCESRTHLTMPTHGCLCELAKQIGFQSGARNIFSLKEQLFTFRHQADLARKDRLARSLSLPKLKFPFPNMVGICVQESSSGRLQLLSQGTGEILLDACVDYWNGSDLCPLTSTDRKRILDFYNRSSLTAYCTAFAYRPLSGRMINATGNEAVRLFGGAGVYLELPSDSAHLYQPQRSPDTPALWESTAAGSMRSDSRIQSDGNLYNSSALAGGYLSRSNDSLLADMTEEDAQSAQGVFNVTCNQTFVAMVTMQYQARTDMVQLIEQMDKACIRFVHFSKENELRSRVFSEKMGLESGWNCHISLLSDKADNEDNSADAGKQRHQKSMASLAAKDAIRDDTVAVARNALTSLEQCRPLSVSAPSAINVEMVQVKFEDEISLHSLTDSDDEREKLFGDRKDDAGIVSMKTPSPHRHHFNLSQNSSLDCSSSSLVLLNDVQGADSSCCDVNLSRSQSHVTESTEQSAPVAFDMSNRAKLPRGIDEIRPHIENVDNVPLLVSLFTDCTPSATRQMIQIMQDNGEVVCIVGSSASGHNTPIFMQADASLAVEPLYPQVCQQVPVCEAMSEANAPSPVELSRRLNSLPCALSFHRDELPSTLLHLVLESRHIGFYIRNVLQLWAASAASLSLIQLMAAFLFLPPILTTGQVLWLACVTVPLLSVSLIGAPTDPSVMNVATGKNYRHLDRETLSFVAWCYSCKLLPSLIMLVVIFCAALMDVCTKVSAACVQTGQCVWIYPSRNGSVVQGLWSGWGEPAMRDYLYQIQHWIALAYVLYLVFISMSFIHRQYHLWQRNPFSNRLWVAICVLVICLQVLYFTCSVFLFADGAIKSDCDLRISVPWPSWLVFLWPVPLLGFNELVKHYEIKVNVRLQKRARLEFGTKLGMNSPF